MRFCAPVYMDVRSMIKSDMSMRVFIAALLSCEIIKALKDVRCMHIFGLEYGVAISQKIDIEWYEIGGFGVGSATAGSFQLLET